MSADSCRFDGLGVEQSDKRRGESETGNVKGRVKRGARRGRICWKGESVRKSG